MATTGNRGGFPAGGSPVPEEVPSERELIVVATPEARLQVTLRGVASATGSDTAPLSSFLDSEGVALQPLFGLSEERLRDRTTSLAADTSEDVPDLSVYYLVEAPDERMDELAEGLREQETVEAAYVKPPAAPAVAVDEEYEVLNAMVPSLDEPPLNTPDFTPNQIYLNPAPAGIDARYAWTLPGGRGASVRIIDCEWGWRFTHEDLLQTSDGCGRGHQCV